MSNELYKELLVAKEQNLLFSIVAHAQHINIYFLPHTTTEQKVAIKQYIQKKYGYKSKLQFTQTRLKVLL